MTGSDFFTSADPLLPANKTMLFATTTALNNRAGSVSKFSGFGFFKEVEYGFGFLRFFILPNFSVSVFNGFA